MNRSGKIWLCLLLISSSSMIGCGKQIEDWVNIRGRLPQVPVSPIVLKTSGASEFVPASRQYTPTLQRGYYTSSSVAGLQSEVVQTSARGYKIYSSVQGVVLSTNTTN